MVDKSDLQFTGAVKNYKLWFEDIKVGKSQITLDFKSERFALDDILGKGTRRYVPRGYRHEEANNVVLKSEDRLALRYRLQIREGAVLRAHRFHQEPQLLDEGHFRYNKV
ncbi:MAG: hypothetical protein WDO15_11810 [Bacteroidota bacterium]